MSLDSIPMLRGAVPIVGHGPALSRDRFAILDQAAREQVDVVRMRFLTRDVVLVNSPASVHEVLVSKARAFEKSPVLRAALYPLAGEGLFTSGGALWRRQRRLMAPVFQHAKIDAFANVMVECAEHSSRQWRDGAVIDVAAETTRIAMAVAGRTLFGMDTSGEADTLAQAMTVALHWTDTAARSLPLILQVEARLTMLRIAGQSERLRNALEPLAQRLEAPLLWPSANNRALRSAIALLDERVQRMIDERRRAGAATQDLLSHLLRARDESDGSGMSDKQMRDEILTLFIAGHETTANGLAWSLYSLAREPRLYARARACVDALGGRTPTLADVGRLDFLSCVFKESLRLYPPVYLFGRIAVEDVSVGGHMLPNQTVILISPWTLQRRPDLWPDPLRFDPDRFAAANQARQARDAWIPFSDGPRVCIGQHFAQLEAPLVLASLLQRADFSLLDERPIKPDAAATLRPQGGVKARIRLRSAPGAFAEHEGPVGASGLCH
jgi:cytochrome P450